MLIEIFLLLLTIILGFYLYVWRAYKFWEINGVQSIESKFPWGMEKPKNREHMCHTFNRYYTNFKAKEQLIGMYFFLQPVALITNVSLVKQIFVTDFQYFTSREFYYNEKYDPLSVHLISIEGDRWKPMRTKLTPAFTPNKMKMLYPLINNICSEFKCTIDKLLKVNEVINVQDLMMLYTTEFISSTCFGIETNSLNDPNSDFRRYGGRALLEAQDIVFKAILVRNFKSIARFFGYRAISPDVSDFFLTIVKETVIYREKNNIKRNDLLDVLIKLKNDINNEQEFGIKQIAAQCFAFFVGGTETSARTMSFALYELSQPKNKHMQERARDEINRVMNKYNNQLTSEASDELIYLDQIIKGLNKLKSYFES